MKSGWITAFAAATATVLLLACVGVSWGAPAVGGAGGALPAIDNVKISFKTQPRGWVLAREIHAKDADLAKLEARLGVPVEGVLNQIFQVGKDRVQINYVALMNAKDAQTAFLRLLALVGPINSIVLRNTVVIEIISDKPLLRVQAQEILAPGPIHKVKLHQADLPKGWLVLKEYLVPKSRLKLLKKRFGTELRGILNQYLLCGKARAQVNYVLPVKGGEQAALDWLKRCDAGNENVILLSPRGAAVEIISANPEAKQQIADLIKKQKPIPLDKPSKKAKASKTK